MIPLFKIGTDIVKISRIEKSIKNERFLKEVYTEGEIHHCKKAESFAGLFAAKEAYFKALGTGIKRPMCKVEILYNENGKPYLSNIKNSDVSISHDGEYAIATVILW